MKTPQYSASDQSSNRIAQLEPAIAGSHYEFVQRSSWESGLCRSFHNVDTPLHAFCSSVCLNTHAWRLSETHLGTKHVQG